MQTEDSPVTDHRTRLLQGLAQSVATKGYADTTIADIVREAGVSRRTFYEQFDDKPSALIALYESASLRGLRVLRESIDPARDWQTQVDQALSAYLGSLAQNPVLLRTLFVEILGLGATGLAARRRVHDQMADFMLDVINAGREPARLERPMALAVVGGIHELVLQAIEQDRAQALPDLSAAAGRLLLAVVQGRAA
ncbi:MAG: TetR/AcrR family transcriptional regulator [Comamonadaceae bacterium]|jgi:AcrR family transcriptional regulator|uniref:TetR/AcrR family transcriptional regulator n=1 Tax=Candidatus Skiveiella danica TaxID=3386177 RepID=UPI00390900F3|nr:TetR/AcrR family transcriptional regulator [Comamonadaceae bacterium]MBK7991352.1 TetR/AcrR family transcriptional regulator [Comamonadaceae bacterium]MBK8360561.1 TetR/AcrR family transcriptional regulator [Comamonadaceae bacterium]